MALETLDDVLSRIPSAEKSTGRHWPNTSKALFADYALLAVDRNDVNIIHGNWRDNADAACVERTVDRHVLRSELLGYDYEKDCSAAGSQGVWRFTTI
jgi:hypothetical protein